jgi:hypothetical protein
MLFIVGKGENNLKHNYIYAFPFAKKDFKDHVKVVNIASGNIYDTKVSDVKKDQIFTKISDAVTEAGVILSEVPVREIFEDFINGSKTETDIRVAYFPPVKVVNHVDNTSYPMDYFYDDKLMKSILKDIPKEALKFKENELGEMIANLSEGVDKMKEGLKEAFQTKNANIYAAYTRYMYYKSCLDNAIKFYGDVFNDKNK